MSPVLAEAASDLHVSTAAAGQLRTVDRPRGRASRRCLLGALGEPFGLGRQLLGGLRRCSRSARSRARRRRASLCSPGPGAGRRRRGRDDDRGDARRCGMGGARAADAHALLGARRPAGRLDRRHAADRARRRAQLALRLARAPARRRRRGRSARRLAARQRPPPVAAVPARAPTLGRPLRWRAGSHPSCSRTPPGRERSSTRARSSPSRTGPPPALTGCLLALAAGAYVAGNLACRASSHVSRGGVLVLLAVVLARRRRPLRLRRARASP